MSNTQQILSYIKSINERLNLLSLKAKKVEELPEMSVVNTEALLLVSELDSGVYKSKKLAIQKIVDSLSLSGQDNKVRDVLLGSITDADDLAYLLDNFGITVSEKELVILTVLATVNSTLVQKQYLWKLGKGSYNPIGSSNINLKLIELQPRFLNEITSDELTNSPSAIVYDFGVITDNLLTVLNTASPARDYTDDSKIYYIRATKDGVNLLYNFVGINGIYGASNLQMTNSDLVLVYSSEISNTNFLDLKLDKGGYLGTAQDLKNEIDFSIPLKSKFTLVQKSTDNSNSAIELNDFARGFGPGVGVDSEYYYLAQYLNLTTDNNVHNHLNYKPILVTLPNS